MTTLVAKFAFEKETKGAIRFQEVEGQDRCRAAGQDRHTAP